MQRVLSKKESLPEARPPTRSQFLGLESMKIGKRAVRWSLDCNARSVGMELVDTNSGKSSILA